MDPSPRRSKKILLIVILLLLVGGAAAYFLTKNNDNSSKSSKASSSSNSQQAGTGSGSFAPVATSGQPFVATITSTGASSLTATMEYDAKGNVSYSYKQDGKTTKIIYTLDAYYLCSGDDKCIKYPANQSGSSGFNPNTYQYDASRLSGLKSTQDYKGRQACPGGGTCDVWSATNNSTTTTVYLNSSSHRVAGVTTKTDSTTSNVVYQYKAVKITVPTNATELPTP